MTVALPTNQSPMPERWFGVVPSHWTTPRVATLFREVDRPADPKLPVLSVSIHSGVSDGELTDEERDRKVNLSEDRSKYQRVQPGDLVYNMMRAWQGAFGTVTVDGLVSPAYVVAEPKASFRTRFVELLLQTASGMEEVRRFSKGIADFRMRLYWEHFRNIVVCLPPLAEQDMILVRLDQECGRIDRLVEKKRRFIELLREKRHAVVTKAVTTGLDPDCTMKEFHSSWLRSVPSTWMVAPVKHFFRSLDGQRVPLSSEDRGRMQGKYPYYGATGIIDHVDRPLFREDLVLVSEDGANLTYRTYPIAFVARGEYWVNNHAHILRPHDGLVDFWADRLEAIDLIPFLTGSTQPKLTIEKLMNIRVAVPSTIKERRDIALQVKADTQKLDSVIKKTERSIELLKEHRSALIANAVTGKAGELGKTTQEMKAAA